SLAGSQLILENCQPPNQAIDPLETVTLNFALVNHGLAATTNLTAALLPTAAIKPLSNAQLYGALGVNAAPTARAFTFMVDGACGQTYTAQLELREGNAVVGTLPVELTLGALKNGQFVCCSS